MILPSPVMEGDFLFVAICHRKCRSLGLRPRSSPLQFVTEALNMLQIQSGGGYVSLKRFFYLTGKIEIIMARIDPLAHRHLWGNQLHEQFFIDNGADRNVHLAYVTLLKLDLAYELAAFTPTWTGTYPIGIYTGTSDLDIICEAANLKVWLACIRGSYGAYEEFQWEEDMSRGEPYVSVSFLFEGFQIELFGQKVPVQRQYAFRHMMIEGKILTQASALCKEAILKLKQEGLNTEHAFAQVLRLPGDPYKALLDIHSSDQIDQLLERSGMK